MLYTWRNERDTLPMNWARVTHAKRERKRLST